MYEIEKIEMIETALKMKEYRLIAMAGGNVSLRLGNGHFLVTPSGMEYDKMRPDDILEVDAEGAVVNGHWRPSVDLVALLYIYKNLPDVNAIIHTHQVYATAAGLIGDVLPAAVTTLANCTLGPVNVADYSSAASLEMGVQAVKFLDGKRAVILKNHGVITVGGNLDEALHAAVYMEDAAKTYLLAKAAGTPVILTDEQVEEAVDAYKKCGQDK
ncbi:class II aldolase/adducin family protein [Christensenellaceae bacterium OttesenSCG-928-K19]|nr:class II aldolase/adducin family protein [Christensenellaceae bacterium OttesenSCG-928-K19]